MMDRDECYYRVCDDAKEDRWLFCLALIAQTEKWMQTQRDIGNYEKEKGNDDGVSCA